MKRLRSSGAALALGLGLALALAAPVARADLLDDAAALRAAYVKAGGRVRRSTLFVDEGASASITIADRRDARRRCLTIVAIAERHVELAMSVAGRKGSPIVSRGGVARFRRCGGALRARQLGLTLGEGAGAIEVLAIAHARPLAAPEAVLPERAIGEVESDPDLGEPLPSASLARRVARARQSAELDGAARVDRFAVAANAGGSAREVRELPAGCHRLSLLGDKGDSGVELDADVRVAGAVEALAADRGHAADATLEFCLGAAARVDLRVTGAAPSSEVAVLDARWPLPVELDASLGPAAAGALAYALHHRRLPALGAPSFQAIGLQGVTALPMTIEPGACYVGAVAVAAGEATSLRLGARVGPEIYADDAEDAPYAAVVTFCARPRDAVAELAIDLRADRAAWFAAWWRVGGLHAP